MRQRAVRTQGSAEAMKTSRPEDITNSGPSAMSRVMPRGDSGKIRASKQKLKASGQVTVPNKLTLQQANGIKTNLQDMISPRAASNRVTQNHSRTSSIVQERRDFGFTDVTKKSSFAVSKVPKALPSHRQDIFSFMDKYKVGSAKDGSGPYASSVAVGEHSQQSTSAESNKPLQINSAPLLAPDEGRYLKLYGRELFDDMIENEYKSQFNALLTN